jgi:hypothetical protein
VLCEWLEGSGFGVGLESRGLRGDETWGFLLAGFIYHGHAI